MCEIVSTTLMALAGGGAATAAGATAAAATTAATTAATLQTIGTIAGIGGAVYSGVSGYQTAKRNAASIKTQRETEANLSATQDQREREGMMEAIRVQSAQLAARGINLGSPTAVLLGETAAREMTFQSQATRSGAFARDAELSLAGRQVEAQGKLSLLKGGVSAVTKTLNAAPEIWPELVV